MLMMLLDDDVNAFADNDDHDDAFMAAGSQKRHLWDPAGGLLQLLMARQLQLLSVCLSKDVNVHKNLVSKASDYCEITLLQNYSNSTLV